MVRPGWRLPPPVGSLMYVRVRDSARKTKVKISFAKPLTQRIFLNSQPGR